ncbi:MAG: hypothetical protein ACKKL6_00195 [Candidatus Komeilibacteria bacterium]
MKSKKMTLMILGIVLFLVGLIWILAGQGFWLNWLILVVGVVLFVLSMVGKEKPAVAAPVAPEMPAPAAPEPMADESTEEAPKAEM